MKILYFLLAFLGCGWLMPFTPTRPEPLPVGETATIQGEVIASSDACVRDGICSLTVETDSTRYIVIWAQGDFGETCQHTDNIQSEINIGDAVEAYGMITAPFEMTLCLSPEYYIRLQTG